MSEGAVSGDDGAPGSISRSLAQDDVFSGCWNGEKMEVICRMMNPRPG